MAFRLGWTLVALCAVLVAVSMTLSSDESGEMESVCASLRLASDLARLVVVGDLHGDSDALKEVLVHAGLSTEEAPCTFVAAQPTTLVQLGDVVDRGPDSAGCNACLRDLQRTVPAGSAVVRLVGNHELMWAEQIFRYASKAERPTMHLATATWRDEVAQGAVVGAHAHGPILLTHAGFRPEMLDLVHPHPNDLAREHGAAQVAQALADYVRGHVVEAARLDRYENEVFSAGPDRGGSAMGGCFWTDFGVLERASSAALPEGLVQVVGHTASYCEAWRESARDCEPIRARPDLKAIVADAGLSTAYASNRAYVEFQTGRLRAVTRGPHGLWRDRDLSAPCDARPPAAAAVAAAPKVKQSPFFTISDNSRATA